MRVNYVRSSQSMLEQVSVIPAIPFHYQDISRWTSIEKKSDLEKMVRTGWLQSDHQFKTTYIMHSVIASAIRAQFEDTLYSDCHEIIRALTNEMYYKADEHGWGNPEIITNYYLPELNDISIMVEEV